MQSVQEQASPTVGPGKADETRYEMALPRMGRQAGVSAERTSWLMRNLVLVVWLAALVGGSAAVLLYKGRAGEAAHAPARWPTDSTMSMARGPDAATVVLFAHPKCACTRASLEELATLLQRTTSHPRVYVSFAVPEGRDRTWADGESLRRAAGMSGVLALVDLGGAEARKFGAVTSGQVMVYDGTGALRYAGGITASRGHVGENMGRAAALQALSAAAPAPDGRPVFGCPMTNPARDGREGATPEGEP